MSITLELKYGVTTLSSNVLHPNVNIIVYRFLHPLNVDLLNESNYTFIKNIPNEQYVENISKNLGYVHKTI